MRDRSFVHCSLASILLAACPGGAATDPDGATASDTTGGETTTATASASTSSGEATLPTTGDPTTGATTGPESTSEPATGSTGSTGPGPVCGDGVVDPGEGCDDGPDNGPGNACDEACQPAVCGDGQVGPGEQCDDGPDNADANSCTADCTHNVCGDGKVGPGEGCDDADADDADECTNACALASCGDGVVSPTEACDDGNADDTDACTAACTAATCSDGFVQPALGEQCDDGADNADDAACTTACRLAVCGDGHVWGAGGEACDAGAENGPGKACNAQCQLNVCGDGDPGPDEGCDDGNLAPGDGCSASCELEGCGNAIVDPGEQCDDGKDGDADDGCTDACKLPACGDGFVQQSLGEQCDLGGANSDAGACTLACEHAVCGDGLVHAQVEQCDDGANNGPGQACKANCAANVCGDGDKGPGEACDDGNASNVDGCTNVCKLASCGDGFVQPGEACDDGNTDDTDGCTNTCEVDTCGDGVVQPGEACDDGDDDDLDGCTSACQPTQALDVSAGYYQSCAVLSGGAVRCWGNGVGGNLGYANTTTIGDNEHPNTAGPVKLGGPAVDVESGYNVTCVRMAGGDLRCWGSNHSGMLGLGYTTIIGDNEHPDAIGPVPLGGKVVQVSTRHNHICAVMEGGDLRCWGRSVDGELGLATGAGLVIGDNELPTAVPPVKIGGKALQVAASVSFTCVLLEGGAVRCWGSNTAGKLGLGHVQTIGDDEHPDSQPPVKLGGAALQIATGDNHVCALLAGGDVRCWGSNYHYQLGFPHPQDIGDNEHPDSVAPVQIGGKAIKIDCGGVFACAQLENGDVRCWGRSTNGQLGYPGTLVVGENSLPDAHGPVKLGGIPTVLDLGPAHSCVVLPTGKIRCWGNNGYGRLGLAHTNHIGDTEHPSSAPYVSAF